MLSASSSPAVATIVPRGVRAWVTFENSSGFSGTVTFVLDQLTCSQTVSNFRFLCEGHRDPESYARRSAFLGPNAKLPPPLCGTHVLSVRKDDMLEFGSSPDASYWGGFFNDEFAATASTTAARNARPFTNNRVGCLSMSNVGKNKNASRFFITLREQPELDAEFVPFGYVVEGMDVLQQLNNVPADPRKGFAPRDKLRIVECGIVDAMAGFRTGAAAGGASARNQAEGVGTRRGRDTDAVLSGSLDVARVAVDANAEDGIVEDSRIHSTMAMAGALKKRRGEVASGFAGELSSTQIDMTLAGHGGHQMTTKEAFAAQRRTFEADLMEVKETQKHKKGTLRMKKQKDQQVQERHARTKAKQKAASRTKFY